MKNNHRRNWAQNYEYKAKELFAPDDARQVREIVIRSEKIKALGSRHCFNDIADSSLTQISTENLTRLVALDENDSTVTIESGLQYGKLCPALEAKGFALPNLASLPHISVAGACATATHGSGIKNGNLAAAVKNLEFTAGNGETINLRDAEKLNGAVVNLGALGIVTKLTLKLEKTFSVRQNIFQNLRFEVLKENFEAIISAGYSVSLFTDWQRENINQVWVKSRVEKDAKPLPPDFYGATAATENLHPISGISAENCTAQMGFAGVWYDRLPHFKMGFTPSSGLELQSEYFVPLENAVEAIAAVEKIKDSISPYLLISEIRVVAADELWLSPCYRQTCVAVHFTWKQEPAAVFKLLPLIEAELAPFKARPHWGKLFTTAPKVVRSFYPKLPDFLELMQTYDPQGKFLNDYLERMLLN